MEFRDNRYAESVESWEETVSFDTVLHQGSLLVKIIPSVFVVGLCVGGWNWKVWIALGILAYWLVAVLARLYAVNENVRFVRHQLRAFRESVSVTSREVLSDCEGDREGVTVLDVLMKLNHRWED